MDLPVIPTPLLPRWVWMEEVTYSHIPIATLVTAFLFLAPIFEYIGYRRKDMRYDRLAKSLVFFSMILFSPGAALGTGIPMFIIGLYPEFWSRWANIFFWPLIAQFVFFTLEVVVLFFGYYLTWDRWMNRKRLHILFGVLSALTGMSIQIIWDGIGSYMMTPGAPLPGVNEPVGWSAQGFFNPSFPYLFTHRFFANISYTMLLAGGVFALKYLHAKVKEEKNYFAFAADITFSIGFLAFFAMPFIGWGYAKILQHNAPVAFHAIMGGHSGSKFIFKMAMVSVFLTIAAVYLFIRHRDKPVILSFATAGLASLYLFLSWHPALDWFGSTATWRIAYTIVLVGFIAFLWVIRKTDKQVTSEPWQWAMFIAGIAAFLAFAMGGFVRERARQPHTVYKQIIKPEVLPREADEFLVYDKCVVCHSTPKFLDRYKKRDWVERVKVERERPGVDITDDEVEHIIRYLRERYP
ncbi:MAG: cytochrome ubiquinol oxidase subunit I [Candidatus Latescibacteria bacterium]|nr:cytochrome ubiquinol oxidase subunit I [Candidatus Latescibacterota bacterium]